MNINMKAEGGIPLVVDKSVPEGEVQGFSWGGRKLCVIRYVPNFEHIDLEPGDVHEWHVAPSYERRLRALVWWRLNDFFTEARA